MHNFIYSVVFSSHSLSFPPISLLSLYSSSLFFFPKRKKRRNRKKRTTFLLDPGIFVLAKLISFFLFLSFFLSLIPNCFRCLSVDSVAFSPIKNMGQAAFEFIWGNDPLFYTLHSRSFLLFFLFLSPLTFLFILFLLLEYHCVLPSRRG